MYSVGEVSTVRNLANVGVTCGTYFPAPVMIDIRCDTMSKTPSKDNGLKEDRLLSKVILNGNTLIAINESSEYVVCSNIPHKQMSEIKMLFRLRSIGSPIVSHIELCVTYNVSQHFYDLNYVNVHFAPMCLAQRG